MSIKRDGFWVDQTQVERIVGIGADIVHRIPLDIDPRC